MNEEPQPSFTSARGHVLINDTASLYLATLGSGDVLPGLTLSIWG